ncbi:DUF982 domain-containing protein [Aliirhizobium cellulosilyticum]|uniref:DUF982 domain-containing protein n=1 Tax=Aliirhizobium cellulosilyticum TaxID=393664 RepID=UPI003744646D
MAQDNSNPGRAISSVEDAARALLTNWPGDEGDRFYEAVKACLDCLDHVLDPASARMAFALAAQEAGTLAKY